eukprot:Rmarinus@m.29272
MRVGRGGLLLLGSPSCVVDTVFRPVFDHCRDRGISIAGVVTQRLRHGVTPVHKFARANDVPVLSPASTRDPAFIRDVETLNPSLALTAGYGLILPNRFLEVPRLGVVNIHPSLLPEYRGAAPVARALMDGVRQTGVSVVFTVRKVDAGPVLAQVPYDVDEEITAPALTEKLFSLGSSSFLSFLPGILSGSVRPDTCHTQNDRHSTKAGKIHPREGLLDLSLSSWDNHNIVRALGSEPGVFAYYCGHRSPYASSHTIPQTRSSGRDYDGVSGRGG